MGLFSKRDEPSCLVKLMQQMLYSTQQLLKTTQPLG